MNYASGAFTNSHRKSDVSIPGLILLCSISAIAGFTAHRATQPTGKQIVEKYENFTPEEMHEWMKKNLSPIR
jgi:hypothetical protein